MEPALDPGRDDTHALLALVLAGGAVAPRLRLLECHAAPAAAWRTGPAAWREAGLDARQIARLGTPDRERAALGRAWLDLPGHHLIGWRAPQFPPLLAAAPQPPLALFVEGDPALLWRAQLAVVGARAATAGGLANARLFALAFARTGWCVASGMAAGIDAAAHRAVLEAGHPTVAVLGTGPDLAYPRHHAGLREAIAAHGALVSEHPPGTAARAAHFPARNRILAGLALGTVVVEAALRSGALITARLAAEAGREVFALPGSIHNPMARGCHRLIRDGVALVETPDQVLEDMAAALTRYAATLPPPPPGPIQGDGAAPHAAVPAAATADPDYNRLWSALGHDPTGMDELVGRTGLTPARLSSMLLAMELDGKVAAAHGRYQRAP
jgi:DNA processing protein